MATELVLWILGIIVSFLLGFLASWIASWYFYRKERKDTMANAKILKELRQYANAQIRIGDNKNGKIVERSDGTIAIDWNQKINDSMVISDSLKTVLTKGNNQKS